MSWGNFLAPSIYCFVVRLSLDRLLFVCVWRIFFCVFIEIMLSAFIMVFFFYAPNSRLGLFMESQSSLTLCSYINLSLTITELSNSSTLFSIPNSVFYMTILLLKNSNKIFIWIIDSFISTIISLWIFSNNSIFIS